MHPRAGSPRQPALPPRLVRVTTSASLRTCAHRQPPLLLPATARHETTLGGPVCGGCRLLCAMCAVLCRHLLRGLHREPREGLQVRPHAYVLRRAGPKLPGVMCAPGHMRVPSSWWRCMRSMHAVDAHSACGLLMLSRRRTLCSCTPNSAAPAAPARSHAAISCLHASIPSLTWTQPRELAVC